MVEANSDPEVVTALILRETREAAAARAAHTSAPKTATMRYAHMPARGQAAAETAVAVEQGRPDVPASAPSGPWSMQLVFAAALVAVLLAVWVAERRSIRRAKEGLHGR